MSKTNDSTKSVPPAQPPVAAGQKTEEETPGGSNQPPVGAAKAPAYLRVKTKSGRPFRRAGVAFGREPVVLETAKLTDAQVKAITAEEQLAVETFAADPRAAQQQKPGAK